MISTAPATDRAAVQQIIQALKDAGHTLVEVNNGEEVVKVSTQAEALDAIFEVDEARLYVNLPASTRGGWIYFVLGESPLDVAANWTVNLGPVLNPLTDQWWS